jgi:uroporphyrinogen decarboxylase
MDTNAHLIYFKESLRKLSESYGKEIPIVAPWIGPFELATCLLGLERFMDMLLFDPATAEAFLEKTSEYTVNWGNALLKEGANFLVHTATMSNISVVTETIAAKTVAPLLAKTYSKIQGGIIFHHGGGRIQPLLPIYKNLPHLGGFAIDHEDDLQVSRELLGLDTLLLGNVEGPTLVYKEPAEIEKLGNRMLEIMSADTHYILATTSADIAYDTDLVQIKALIRSVKNF